MEDLLLLLFALASFADARPTRESITVASFTEVAKRKHKEAGIIRIYRSTVEDLPCFRGSASVEGVGMDALLEVVMDIEAVPDWSSAGVTESVTLARSNGHIEFYEYLDIPGWTLVADRFWFLRGTVDRTPDTTAFWWDRLESGGAHADRFAEVREAHPKAVEPPINVGSWILSRAGEAMSVTYTVCTDPGGTLPQAIQNFATRRTLPDTVGELIGEARRRQGS